MALAGVGPQATSAPAPRLQVRARNSRGIGAWSPRGEGATRPAGDSRAPDAGLLQAAACFSADGRGGAPPVVSPGPTPTPPRAAATASSPSGSPSREAPPAAVSAAAAEKALEAATPSCGDAWVDAAADCSRGAAALSGDALLVSIRTQLAASAAALAEKAPPAGPAPDATVLDWLLASPEARTAVDAWQAAIGTGGESAVARYGAAASAAAFSGNLAALRWLCGCGIDSPSLSSATPSGEASAFRLLLAAAQVCFAAPTGAPHCTASPLHAAALGGAATTLDWCLDALLTCTGVTAASPELQASFCETLLTVYALPGAEGLSAIHLAARHGSSEQLGRLLSRCRDPAGAAAVRDANGWSSLHHAALGSHAAALSILTLPPFSLDSASTDSAGRTAVHLAAGANAASALYWLLCRHSAAAPAEIAHTLDTAGLSPLHYATLGNAPLTTALILALAGDKAQGTAALLARVATSSGAPATAAVLSSWVAGAAGSPGTFIAAPTAVRVSLARPESENSSCSTLEVSWDAPSASLLRALEADDVGPDDEQCFRELASLLCPLMTPREYEVDVTVLNVPRGRVLGLDATAAMCFALGVVETMVVDAAEASRRDGGGRCGTLIALRRLQGTSAPSLPPLAVRVRALFGCGTAPGGWGPRAVASFDVGSAESA